MVTKSLEWRWSSGHLPGERSHLSSLLLLSVTLMQSLGCFLRKKKKWEVKMLSSSFQRGDPFADCCREVALVQGSGWCGAGCSLCTEQFQRWSWAVNVSSLICWADLDRIIETRHHVVVFRACGEGEKQEELSYFSLSHHFQDSEWKPAFSNCPSETSPLLSLYSE